MPCSINRSIALSKVSIMWSHNAHLLVPDDELGRSPQNKMLKCPKHCVFSMFDCTIVLSSGQTVMQLTRPLRCQGCCCPCSLQEMEIFCPPGNKIATVKEM